MIQPGAKDGLLMIYVSDGTYDIEDAGASVSHIMIGQAPYCFNCWALNGSSEMPVVCTRAVPCIF